MEVMAHTVSHCHFAPPFMKHTALSKSNQDLLIRTFITLLRPHYFPVDHILTSTAVVGTVLGHRSDDGQSERDGAANGVAKDAKGKF